MRTVKRAAQVILALILVLVVIGAGGGYWFATRSLPQVDGTLQVAGLKSKVEVLRDMFGIPQIYAENEDDLFFAQGYVTAQDRLWQLEYNSRIGHGTLSDIFGATTIKQDRYLRTIGLDRAARADWAAMSEAARQPLQKYADGVNAFISSHQDNLPLEFVILGFKPAPWEPLDTVAWAKVMAYNLGGNYEAELTRASLIEKLGATKAKELVPDYPSAGPFIISPDMKEYKPETREYSPSPFSPIGIADMQEHASVAAVMGLRSPEIGSNNWVIDGVKSKTGRPILANDPHLGIQLPSIWYETGLHCAPRTEACPYNVVGYTFPGTPGIVIGHNDRIAWGVTNLGPDVQDLYIEKINPSNPNQYEFQGKWEEMQVVDEPIKVKGVVSETLHVQITRHGPIMTPVLTGVTQPLALQWTALKEPSHLAESVVQLNKARDWEEFRAALRLWDVPSQNFVFADVDGNIGYQMPGNVPIRAKGDGTLPVSGSGDYEWKGYIPFDELPFVYNPPTHFIATANNAVVPATYRYWITADWAAPYRQQRIIDLLKAKDKLSVEDFKAIQKDVYSLPEVQLQKYVSGLTPEGFLQQRAMEYVKNWDGYLKEDTIGGTILEVTYQRLAKNLFAEPLGKAMWSNYLTADNAMRRLVLELLEQPNSEWWGNAGRDAMLRKSYAEAVDWLGSQFGDAPGDWKWARLHTATFTHPLGSVQPLNLIFNAGPVGAPGGVFTVFATSFKNSAPYAVSSVSSMREIIDVSNWDNSLQTHTVGQSGQPFSKHFSDMVQMWRNVDYAPMYFTRGSVDQARAGLLILVP